MRKVNAKYVVILLLFLTACGSVGGYEGRTLPNTYFSHFTDEQGLECAVSGNNGAGITCNWDAYNTAKGAGQ